MSERSWSRFFVVAAVWNLVIAVPIIVAPEWSYSLAYPDEGASDAVLALWRDFGITVLLIGLGYYLVSRDLYRNRGIVIVGLLGKLIIDVIGIGWRYLDGMASQVALFAAAVDAVFVVAFLVFLLRFPDRPVQASDA